MRDKCPSVSSAVGGIYLILGDYDEEILYTLSPVSHDAGLSMCQEMLREG